jgi:hypothetical protein
MITSRVISVFVLIIISQSAFADDSPRINPYLAAPTLAITHVDPQASDSIPYSIPAGTFKIDLANTPEVSGGPINIMTLASTLPGYMWGVSSGGVTYIDSQGNNWKEIARATVPGVDVISAEQNQKVLSQAYTSVTNLMNMVTTIYKTTGLKRMANGIYSLVDNDNIVYANFNGNSIYAFGLTNPYTPTSGIQIVASKIMPYTITGLSMTYDGNIIVVGSNSLTIINRKLDKILAHVDFGQDETITNSVAVDENNGIYVASDKYMRKVIWTGKSLSTDAKDGAWSSLYDTGRQPPSIKVGTGTGSTPSLMGFEDGKDKLVVITDGADQMDLVAFWRNDIPADFKQQPSTKSRRIAGQIRVTCGFTQLPDFIQSEQSVVIKDYGAFVVNNVGYEANQDLLVSVIAIGPLRTAATGVERFEWDPQAHKWHSVWANPTVVSISMAPVVSIPANMVLVNGYTQQDGWEVTGLDWDTGAVVHRTLFGQTSYGNGAYGLIELPADNNMIFNSIAGPFRIIYVQDPQVSK